MGCAVRRKINAARPVKVVVWEHPVVPLRLKPVLFYELFNSTWIKGVCIGVEWAVEYSRKTGWLRVRERAMSWNMEDLRCDRTEGKELESGHDSW